MARRADSKATPTASPTGNKPEKQADGKGDCQHPLRWNQVKEQLKQGIQRALEEKMEKWNKGEQGNKVGLRP